MSGLDLTPTDITDDIENALDGIHHVPEPELTGTISGTLRIEGECKGWQPSNVTIHAKAGSGDREFTTTPEEKPGTAPEDPEFGVGFNDYVYEFEDVLYGQYSVYPTLDARCDGRFEETTFADGQFAAPVSVTVSPQQPDAVADFTYLMYPSVSLYPQFTWDLDVGGSVDLDWTVRNARTVEFDQGIGEVSKRGTHTVSPGEETTYTLTATGPAGTRTDSVTVTIEEPTIDRFEADDTEIPVDGSTKIHWATTNATSVSISPQVTDDPGLDGSARVSPDQETTYTLTATNPDGDTATPKPTVTVGIEKPTIDEFYADDETINEGQSTKLHWKTTSATDVSIDPPVKERGSPKPDDWAWVSPTGTQTYTLTATNPDGESVDEPVKVKVDKNASASLDANPEVLLQNNYRTKLTWDADHADTVKLDGDVKQDHHGSETRRPSSLGTHTYRLEASDSHSRDVATAKVRVKDRISGVANLSLSHDDFYQVGNSGVYKHEYENTSPAQAFTHEALAPGGKPDPYVLAITNNTNFDAYIEIFKQVTGGRRTIYYTTVGAGDTYNYPSPSRVPLTLDWWARIEVDRDETAPDSLDLSVEWEMRS